MSPFHLVLIILGVVAFILRWCFPGHKVASTYLRYVALILISITVLAPFLWLVAAAFKDKTVLNEFLFFPPLRQISSATLNLGNFRGLFAGRSSVQGTVYFWQYILNSLFFASALTVIQLFFSSMGGYALAKYSFTGKRPLLGFMIGSMMIPPMILLAPLYKMIVDLHMVDTYWALLVPGAVSTYGMFLFRQAIMAIPDDIIDAGRIDGCSEFGIYLRLVMPLVRPMSGAFCLVSFLGAWNAYLAPNIFLTSQDKLTLPIVLNLYISEYAQQYGVFLAGTLLAIVPPAILFFSLQREFIGGLTSGAVKE